MPPTVPVDAADRSDAAVAENWAVKDKGADFEWSYSEEPHASRRKAIIKAHPEVSAYARDIPHGI
jgi:hypothetical protein